MRICSYYQVLTFDAMESSVLALCCTRAGAKAVTARMTARNRARRNIAINVMNEI